MLRIRHCIPNTVVMAGLDDALEDVDLYISVARSLIHEQNFVPQSHGPAKFNDIMDKIAAEQMVSDDPVYC